MHKFPKNFFDRRGTFWLAEELILEMPETICRIMGHMVITKAEFFWHRRAFQFYAQSMLFEKCPVNCEAPRYYIHVADDGTITATMEDIAH